MRIEQLTFTRFLAAISIVVFHYGQKSFVFNNDYVGFLFIQANVGVSYFFILSGFVMVIAYEKKTKICYAEYFKSRFARIYPIYCFAIFLLLLTQFLTRSIDFEGFFLNLFMIQAWLPGKALSFNSPGWSLSVEAFFYVIFPVLFNVIYKRGNYKTITITVLLFWLMSQIIFHLLLSTNLNEAYLFKDKDLLYSPIMHLNEFLVGNLAGLFYVNRIKSKRNNFDWQIGIVVIVILLVMRFPIGLNLHNGLLALLFIPLILLISFNEGVITKIFKSKFCVFLGEISFGIYILQYPVFSLISSYSLNKYFNISDVTLVFFIRLLILIVLSAVAYVYIEKPIQNKIKNIKFSNKNNELLRLKNEFE